MSGHANTFHSFGITAKKDSNVFKITIKKELDLFLFSLPAESVSLSFLKHKLLDKLLLLAKCVVLKWIKDTAPTATVWCREVFHVFLHEITNSVLQKNVQEFINLWRLLLE